MSQIVGIKIVVLEWEFEVCGDDSMYALVRTSEPRLFQVNRHIDYAFALMFLTLFSLRTSTTNTNI